jgi:hypothetical protein
VRADKQATIDAQYLDWRSYCANWNHPGTSHPCEYLYGQDKSARRRDIAEAAGYQCQGCSTTHTLQWEDGEWDHILGGHGKQHCDCKENGRWVCWSFHRAKHVHVRSDRAERRANVE